MASLLLILYSRRLLVSVRLDSTTSNWYVLDPGSEQFTEPFEILSKIPFL